MLARICSGGDFVKRRPGEGHVYANMLGGRGPSRGSTVRNSDSCMCRGLRLVCASRGAECHLASTSSSTSFSGRAVVVWIEAASPNRHPLPALYIRHHSFYLFKYYLIKVLKLSI